MISTKEEIRRQKISRTLTGYVRSAETKQKMSLSRKGKPLSANTRKKISNALIGRFAGNKNPMFGKSHSPRIIEQIKKTKQLSGSNEKMRKLMLERRKIIIFPVKDTLIEVKIQNYLKQLGIDFFTHQYMNIEHGYQCDILVPSMKLVIECDGNYWHKYPIGRDIDKIRTNELIEHGYQVLRLWEHDIKKLSLEQFKFDITRITQLQGGEK